MGFLLGTIFGSIWRLLRYAFGLIFRFFARVITSLNLSLPFFYALIGLILHLATGFLKAGGSFFYPYHIGMVLVLLISLAITLKKVFGPGKRGRRQEDAPPDYMSRLAYDRPRVFRVKQNPDFIVYEFYDRYQLFHENKRGELEYVRTDFKENVR